MLRMYNHITSHITSHLPISECLPGEEARKDTMVNHAKSNTLKTQIARQRKDNLMAQAIAHYQAEKAKALCYGRSTVVSDLDGLGVCPECRMAEVGKSWTITKSVQRSDG
jgi:hypothetical protein